MYLKTMFCITKFFLNLNFIYSKYFLYITIFYIYIRLFAFEIFEIFEMFAFEIWPLKSPTPTVNPSPPCSLSMSLSATSPLFLSTSKDGDFTSQGSLYQRLTPLLRWNFSLYPTWTDFHKQMSNFFQLHSSAVVHLISHNFLLCPRNAIFENIGDLADVSNQERKTNCWSFWSSTFEDCSLTMSRQL